MLEQIGSERAELVNSVVADVVDAVAGDGGVAAVDACALQ